MARSSLPKGYVTVPLGALVKAKWNYKKDDKDLTAALTRNVKRNGQVENIVIRRLGKEKWEVVNGNHRIDAFRAAGFTEVVAYDLGTVSLAIAKRIAVELNETRFPTDQIDLAKILVGLKKELGLEQLDGLPFTPVDLENMEGLLGFD
jgi:ParB-like chromosome segregation protein Spo0J